MSNPAALIPLTYKATDVQHADFGIFLEIAEGLDEIPSYRGKDIIVPDLEGQIEGNRVANILKIVLVGWLQGSGADPIADFRDNVQALQALFDPTAPGDLVATLEDGDTATIRARTDNLLWGRRALATREVSIEMTSLAPFWTIT